MYTLKSVSDLYLEHYGLIVMKCKRYYDSKKYLCKRAGITLDDLISESFFAVKNAVEAYDGCKDYKIQTYFSYQMMRRFDKLIGLCGSKNPLDECLSLESASVYDDDYTLMNMIPDKMSHVPFERVCRRDYLACLRDDVKSALSYLPEDEHFVIHSYYLQNKSISDIAGSMGVSIQKVRTTLERGLSKLRHPQCCLRKYRQDVG